MNSDKYVGVDVHEATLVVHVMDGRGKFVMQSIIEPNATRIRDFFRALRGTIHVVFEEGTQAAWSSFALRNFVLFADIISRKARQGPQSSHRVHRVIARPGATIQLRSNMTRQIAVEP